MHIINILEEVAFSITCYSAVKMSMCRHNLQIPHAIQPLSSHPQQWSLSCFLVRQVVPGSQSVESSDIH